MTAIDAVAPSLASETGSFENFRYHFAKRSQS